MTKEIKLSELKSDVESGMKKDALVDGNVAAMTTLLKQAGLTIKKTRKSPAFVLVNDITPALSSEFVGIPNMEVLETTEA